MKPVKRIAASILTLVFFLTMLPVSAQTAAREQSQYSSKELMRFSHNLTKMANASIRKYNLHPSAADAYSTARIVADAGNNDFDFSKYHAVEILRDPDGVYIVQFSAPSDAKRCAEQISGDPRIEYVHPDGVLTVCSGETSSMKAASSSLSWGVSHIGADRFASYLLEKGAMSEIIVAVVDTGVVAHPFLNGRIVAGYDFVDDDETPTDGHSHGTHVSGTIIDCTFGLNVKIMPVRVLDDKGSGYTTTIANGIRFAVNNNAKVINMSLDGLHLGNYMEQAVSYANEKGVSVVVAAGNEDSSTTFCCPAHIVSAITVAAIDSKDRRAYFSNYGTAVDVAAPGVDVTSCVPGGYDTYSGTSMATPHVSAAVAMLRLGNPDMTPKQLETLLTQYTRDAGAQGRDNYYGYGIVDLRVALGERITITSLDITKPPNKLTYYVGDYFNVSGMTVTASYTDGTSKKISKYTCSPTCFLSAGDQTVTVSYREGDMQKSASLVVCVKTPKIELSPRTRYIQINQTASIALKTEPIGQYVSVVPIHNEHTEFSCKNGVFSVTGKSVGTDQFDLTMAYGEQIYTVRMNVCVSESTVCLDSVKLLSLPDQTDYYIGDAMDLTGIRLLATYSDGSTVVVGADELECDRLFLEPGEETVRLAYSDGISEHRTIDIHVTVKVPEIRFDPSEISIAVGEQKKVKLISEPAMQLDFTESVSGCAYMTYDSAQEMSFLGTTEGTVIITARGVYQGKTYTAALDVQVGAEIDGFAYRVIRSSTQAEISGYTGDGGDIVVPHVLGGYPVTAIGDSAFNNHSEITSVRLPEGIDTVGFSAFCSNENLVAITLPETVTKIDACAFRDCPNLTAITLPSEITELSRSVFNGCTSLISIGIPVGVRSIGESAFYNCAALENATVPETVQSIGDHAFYCCTSLRTLTLPDRISVVGKNAFGWDYDAQTGAPVHLPGFVVYCYKDSAVHQYAVENSIEYVLLDRPSHVPFIRAASVNGVKGGTVQVPILICDNPGVVSVALSICYDSAILQLLRIENGSVFQKDGITVDKDISQNPIRISWSDSSAKENNLKNGTIATLVFRVLENTGEDRAAVSIEQNLNGTRDLDHKKVVFRTEDGDVTPVARIAGDADSNSVVNLVDAVIIRRYLAGWNSAISVICLSAADVDGSGSVDMADYIILRRYLADWDVVLV